MDPENLSVDALRLFNSLPAEGQREAIRLAESHSEEEAVYLAALRRMPAKQRRELLFLLSKRKWGL